MSELVRFNGSTGHQLVGRLDSPAGSPAACALFAHCFTCSKDLRSARTISRALAERGFAVLRFDFTGLGESAGDFAETDFRSNVEDLVAAADWLRSHHEAPSLLVGHSLGGAAVLVAAERIPEARALVTIGAPSDTEHLLSGLLASAPDESERAAGSGHHRVTLGGRSFEIGQQLLDDLAQSHVTRRLAHLRRALLIMHSPRDEIVDVDHARRLYEGAKHPKSFVSLDDADHLLTRTSDARYAADVLAAWSSRYLPPEAELADEQSTPPAGKVRVRGTGENFFTEIHSQRHRIAADEPRSIPLGTDRGPNPYELLLSALGACTSMTLGLYARRKGWPLEAIEATLEHRRVHAKDCEGCESVEGLIDRIAIDLRLEGDLDAEQRQRLVEISERCPVHKTLTSETRISTRLQE